MSADERRLLDLALRNDLMTFIHRTFQTVAPAHSFLYNWHIEAMAWRLQQCFEGNIKRLLITLPPRNLKSISASVAFPAWVLGRTPTARIVCASYSENLASKHAQDCRAVMESDWFKRVFPNTRIGHAKNTELNYVTTRQGSRYSTSVGGTLTGRGGNILIIDDPLKPEDAPSESKRTSVNEWFDRTLYSRLDDKREGVIILIMQRLHLEDLAGHVTAQEDWVHLDLPAIAECDEQIAIGPNQTYPRRAGELLHAAREPKEVLDHAKLVLGSFNFSAQYQQRPVPLEGEIVHWSWFETYNALPPVQPGDETVQSWDTAYKAEELSDYSVCTTWRVRDKHYYLQHVLRDKLLYPDLKKKVIDHARDYQADVVIVENKGSGMALIDDLRRSGEIATLVSFDPENDKVTRMAAQSAKIEAHQVHLPASASWLDDFRTELLQFPKGRHNDQVDSLSQFLAWIAKRGGTFSVYWPDLRPLPGDCKFPSGDLNQAVQAPAGSPNVLIRVQRGDSSVLISAQEFANQISEEVAARGTETRRW
jgi:predicted phage terminase large subunit-like protein